jgi:hypothetical protein
MSVSIPQSLLALEKIVVDVMERLVALDSLLYNLTTSGSLLTLPKRA